MSQPPPYTPQHSFVADSATLANFPGQALDVEFQSVKATTDAIETNLALIQRDDGNLTNGTVGYDQLSAALQTNGISAATAWVTGVAYAVGAAAVQSQSLYRALIAHTSGVFATDLAAGKWVFVVSIGNLNGSGTSVVGNLPSYTDTAGHNLADSGVALSSLAPKASPALTGTPTLNGSALSVAGPFTITGAFSTTLTVSGATNATLPAGSHTLAGLDVVQSFTAQQSLIGTDVSGSGFRFYRANAIDYTEIYKGASGIGGTVDPLNFYSSNLVATAASLGRDGSLVTANGIMALGTSANALTIGPNGTTNPALNVDASTASSATGINIKSAAATGGVALSVLSSGTNEGMVLNAKGSGGITIGNVSTGGINIVRPLTLGIAGSVVGSLVFGNATSGTATIQPATGALGGTVATLAGGTYNIVGDSIIQTLTNKTFDSAGTGNVLKVSGVTVSAGQYPGETTTGSATAGNVGEYVETVVASGSAVSVVTNTPKDIATLAIPSGGDWDVEIVMQYLFPASTSFTAAGASISTVANTLDATGGRFVNQITAAVVPGAAATASVVVPPLRFSVSGGTTLHMVALATFTVSTLSVYGIIRARRVR